MLTGFGWGDEARVGCNVVIPYREEMAKRHLKVAGDLGRVTFIVSISVGAVAGVRS